MCSHKAPAKVIKLKLNVCDNVPARAVKAPKANVRIVTDRLLQVPARIL